MKSYLFSALLCASLIVSITSCGPKCKQCHVELMGQKSPEQELCGDELKRVEDTGAMVCE